MATINKLENNKKLIFKHISEDRIDYMFEYVNSDGDLNLQDEFGYSVFMYICLTNNDKLFDLSIKNIEKVDLELKENGGNTALMLCLDNPIFVKKLINLNSDIDSQNLGGDTPLIISSFTNNIESVRLLLDYAANENILNDKNMSFFNYLSTKNKKIILKEYPTCVYNALSYNGKFSHFIENFKI